MRTVRVLLASAIPCLAVLVSCGDSAATMDAGMGGSGGVGGTGGMAPAEDCGDGRDNDRDGDIDCMDSDCEMHTCVPAPPEGWMGPVQLYDGATTIIPACGGAFPTLAYEGNRDLVCPAATCDDCACTVISNGICVLPSAVWYSGSNCTGAFQQALSPAPSCEILALLIFGRPTSVLLTERTASGGMCVPTGGDATEAPEPASWNRAGRACAAATPLVGGCAATDLCVPRPATEFLPSVCYYKEGDVGCPGVYTDRHVFYGGVDDTRGCGGCSCGDFVGDPCSGRLSTYEGVTCSGSFVETPTDSIPSCSNVTFNETANFTFSSNPSGACPPSGGPSGGCTETMATTICCLL